MVIIHSLELFTSALADGFSLESEWQQISSSNNNNNIIIITKKSLQDSS